MEYKNIRFVEIKEGVDIPEPRDLTPDEEAAILRKAKAEFDPIKSEAEFADLLRQHEQGLLVSGEELLKWIDELEASGGESHKESV
jgi:hypothetical protein